MEEKIKMPVLCPACTEALKVGKLFCPNCNTEVSGTFEMPMFLKLEPKDQEFVLEFVRSGGSLKEMARKMSLSYPTVRNLLDDIIEKLK